MPDLPSELRNACEKRTLAVFCGAGVSALAPSCLPDWRGFNQAVLQEAKTLALEELPQLDAAIRAAIDELSVTKVNLVAFSDELVTRFAGDSWFPVLEVLDSDRPNANHYALADLAAAGTLHAIVTTNFDTLIERAFRERGVPLSIYVRPEDYSDGPRPATCALYKIHGSTKDAATLVDTASQKLRGLPLVVRARLCDLMRQFHFLFLGFSGADLAFSDDYLGVQAAVRESGGITWVMRPGQTPDEAVTKLIHEGGSRATVREGMLPDFLADLGVTLEQWSGDEAAYREDSNSKARATIGAWLREPHIGGLVCACYLDQLLLRTSRIEAARGFRAALLAHPAISGEKPQLTSPVATFNLALGATARNDIDEALFLLNRTLELHRLWQAFRQKHGIPESPEALRESQMNLSAVWVNIAVCHRVRGEWDEAYSALQSALPLAEASCHDARLGQIHFNFACVEEHNEHHADLILARLDTAQTYLESAGAAQSLFDAAYMRAEQYIGLAEYDSASAAIEKARFYSQVTEVGSAASALALLEADVALRRGEVASAMERTEEAMRACAELQDQKVLFGLQCRFCGMFAFHAPARERVQEVLAELASQRAQATNETSAEAHGVTVSGLRELQDALAAGEISEHPSFYEANPENEEQRLRQLIRQYEFEKRPGELPRLFMRLCGIYCERPPRRLHDTAWALLKAAERSADSEIILEAQDWLGIANHRLGNLDAAAEIYDDVLAASPPPSRALEGLVKYHLAVVKSRLGSLDEAEVLFESSAAILQDQGRPEDLVGCKTMRATNLMSKNELGRALSIAREALEESSALADPSVTPGVKVLVQSIEERMRGKANAAEPRDDAKPTFDSTPLPTEQQMEMMRKYATTPEDLGNISLLEWQAGNRASAWAFSARAIEGYDAEGDLVGRSRCLNNQAQWYVEEGNWGEASKLAREALQIREGCNDIFGAVCALNLIAKCEHAQGSTEAAEAAAVRSLRLIGDPTSSPKEAFNASFLLLRIYSDTGRTAEAVEVAGTCLKAAQTIGDPELAPLIQGLQSITASAGAPQKMTSQSNDAFLAWLTEATRLSKIGAVDQLEAWISAVPQGLVLTTEQQGMIEGTRGNALQNARRDEEAVAAFERAAKLFRQCGSRAMENSARLNASVSLRRLGRVGESDEILNALVRDSDGESDMFNVYLGMATNLMLSYDAADGQAASDLLDSVDALLAKAEACPPDDERRGILLVKKSGAAKLRADTEQAKALLTKALECFRRVNSRHIDVVEAELRRLAER